MGDLVAALLWGVFVAVAVGDPDPDPPPHLLSEVLTCQPDPPSLSLSVTLDGRDLFWFDFPGSRWNPGIPSLPPWPSELESPQEILPEAQLCKEILGVLGRTLTGVMPEARAIPEISLFPALPPVPGEPNTLVCLVENIFPPVLDITWTVAGAVVTQGVTQGPFVPTSDLTFVRLSRISVTTLEPGTVHACVVTSRKDNATMVAYWVAPDTALDEQLDMALAGAALALGIVLVLLGVVLALLARRDRNG
ncbi:HLA class II histocompatibility antigen, DM alpha chain-like [Catharus ustulatus]|uniref:HLA class II histocompatibility antigen, DM alpha chain-like n=1 Tax=Catharus ustulatus TaxID=91951 RepID=UPI00140A751C|nr:HLA class II histocompatibility antigen, DM alpha chain-like [Catharus ustulatus]